MVDTAVLEMERPITSEGKQARSFLEIANSYVTDKITSAWQPDSLVDLRMRLEGAEMQQRWARFIVENYDDSSPYAERTSRSKILGSMKEFEGVFKRLASEPLIKKGFDVKRAGEAAGKVVWEPFKKGIIGESATAFMAKKAGFQLKWPTPDQDVREGIDLIIEKGGETIPLQSKCREGGKFIVKKADFGHLIVVTVPAPPDSYFYKDQEMGVPNWSQSHRFVDYLNKQRGAR